MKKLFIVFLITAIVAAVGIAVFYFHQPRIAEFINQPAGNLVSKQQAPSESPRPGGIFPVGADAYKQPDDNTVIKFPVFNYHHLGPLPVGADINRKAFTVTPEMFEEHLKYFKDNGYQPVYLDDLIEYFDSGKTLPQKAIAITFDDGYREHYRYAFPLLKKYGFVATFFVPTGWVGRADMMTWEQIKEMSAAGMAFGSHAVNHPHLAELSDEELEKELKESKKALEEHLGQVIGFIAYPGGDYDSRVIDAVKAASYKGALGVYKIINQMPKYRWSIRRFHADDNMGSIMSKLIENNY